MCRSYKAWVKFIWSFDHKYNISIEWISNFDIKLVQWVTLIIIPNTKISKIQFKLLTLETNKSFTFWITIQEYHQTKIIKKNYCYIHLWISGEFFLLLNTTLNCSFRRNHNNTSSVVITSNSPSMHINVQHDFLFKK